MPPPVDWTHEKCLLLISKFQTHQALWNRNVKEFHNPKKKEEEWLTLAREIDAPHIEVKKKIECLRGSYRRERSKVRSSKDTYCPKWFAYKYLEFLGETMNYSAVYNYSAINDIEGTSPRKLPHPVDQEEHRSRKRNSDSMERDEYILPHDACELFPMKVTSDADGSQQKPEAMKEEMSFQSEPTAVEAADVGNYPLGTPSNRTYDVRTGSPKSELRKESLFQTQSHFSRNTTPIRIPSNPIGTSTETPSKPLKASSKETSVLSDRARRDVMSQSKIEFSPKKRRMFRSGPYRPIRPKPRIKSKDTKHHKELKSIKKYPRRKTERIVKVSDTPNTSSPVRTTYKEGTGLTDRLLKDDQASENVGDSDQSEHQSEPTSSKVSARHSSRSANESPSIPKLNDTHKQEDEKSDECAAFGQLVESSLRRLPNFQRIKAKMKLSQVLWELELEALSEDTSAALQKT